MPATTPSDVHGTPPGHSAVDVSSLPLERVNAPMPFWRGSIAAVVEIWAYRELLGQLVRKELKVKYKDSVLGFFWTLLRPLLQLVVYSVAIGYFLGARFAIPDFGIYLFTGLVAWSFFSDVVSGCTGSIVGNAGLINKVYFPRELFPLSVVGAATVNFVLQLSVLLVAYVATWTWPDPSELLLVPAALVVMALFGLALGLVLAASNVYLRDMTYLVEVGLLLWFWMTPVVYAWSMVSEKLTGDLAWLANLYLANPMTNVVLAFQQALWPGGQTPEGADILFDGDLWLRLGVLALVSLALLWVAQRIFARAQGNFAKEL